MHRDLSHIPDQSQPSRALVALTDGALASPCRARPLAGFIAQLLACQARVAEFRTRRRGQPQEAAALYGGTRAVPPARVNKIL
jgi:hypothetical protein